MSRNRHLPWLVIILHVVALGGIGLTIVTGLGELNQSIVSTYLLTLLVIGVESRWFGLALLGLSALYLALAGPQHQPNPAHELVALDAFYLLLALVIARLREERDRRA